jgi:TPR repeat protein
LAYYYEKGLGGVKSYQKASYWYDKAAAQKYGPAVKKTKSLMFILKKWWNN